MSRKFALVLSGGGFKGAFQVGALNYILNNKISIDGEEVQINKFDIVAGVSAGSLNGVMVATDQLAKLNELWFDNIAKNGPGIIYDSKYIDAKGKPSLEAILSDLVPKLNVWRVIGLILSKKNRRKFFDRVFNNVSGLKSFADNTPLLQTMLELVDLNMFGDTIYKMGYVSLDDGRYYSPRNVDFTNKVELNKAIVASTSMPIVWAPVDKVTNASDGDKFNLVDGGIRDVSPLGDVIAEIKQDPSDTPYHVVIINCNADQLDPVNKDWNLGSIASRTLIEITLAEIFKNDLKEFLLINDILKSLGKSELKVDDRVYRRFSATIIQPERSLGDPLDTDGKKLFERRDLGFERARTAFGGDASPDVAA